MVNLIDSHCHFDDASFDADRDAAYRRACAAGIAIQVLPAVCARGWSKLKTVRARYPGLYAAYGLHPVYLAEHRPQHLQELGQWLERERPVAVGECGLDFFLPDLDGDTQITYFDAQLKLARDYELPVVIHARRAVDVVIKYIRRYPGLRGTVHSFSGSEQQARRLLDLNFLLSFGGPLSYPRANRLRTLVRQLPLEGLLLETDAPDQPGLTHRGGRNEPAFLPETLAVMAELREQDPTAIAVATSANAQRLFHFDPCPTPPPAPRS
ncbi:MAG: TatD family hydrolase [Gammaproteobacteria bacterium]|nr:TatD family hydrolase [Gammaproteobacteria bacterium]MCP5460072.1 TatD family hydrolase [Gammaproteobacteria bacterium]